jgi:hypothetical protein
MSFRFRPPPAPLSDAASWALLRAFGPREADAPAPSDREAAADLAFRLALAERIGWRWRDDPAAAGIAESDRERFERAFRRSVATGLLYEETARALAVEAAELEVPLVFLKGFALALSGAQPPGSRAFSDLDVLADDEGARALARALGRRGWSSPPITGNEQHLPALRSPQGGVVEIHFRLRGVRVGESAWADATALARAGDLVRAPSLPGECSIPAPEILAAHLLVHGLDQHGHRPRTYPLLRLIGDLADLLPDPAARRELATSLRRVIGDAVSEEETTAALALVDALTAGRLPAPDTPAERLLRHLVAGTLDDDYAASLAVGHLSSRLGTAAREGHLGAYLRRKLWPEASAGRPTGLSALASGARRLVVGIARLAGSAVRGRRRAKPPRSG